MTYTESSPNTLATPMGSSAVNDNTLLNTPRFYSQYPVYHYPQYHEPQYVPQLKPQPQLSQLPQYVPWFPQQHQYVHPQPQLPQHVNWFPPQPQHVHWFPQLPQYVPPLQQLQQLPQLPLYYPDGYYCEIQYVSPQIVSKSNSSHSSPLASSQPPQTNQDDSLAVCM